jgi:hypothetical protein
VINKWEAEYNGTSDSDSETDIGLTLGGGYQMGDLDFRGQLFFPDMGEMEDFMGLLFNVGYTFASL